MRTIPILCVAVGVTVLAPGLAQAEPEKQADATTTTAPCIDGAPNGCGASSDAECVNRSLQCYDTVLWQEDFSCADGSSSCDVHPGRWRVMDSKGVRASVNASEATYRPENVTIGEGGLRITAERTRDPVTRAFYSGGVRTGHTSLMPDGNEGFGFGRLDVVAWVPTGEYALTPAIWLANTTCSAYEPCGSENWPFEIDVGEFRGTNPRQLVAYFSCNSGTWGCRGFGSDPMTNYSDIAAFSPNPFADAPKHFERHTYSITRAPAESFGTTLADATEDRPWEGEAVICWWRDGLPIIEDPDGPYPGYSIQQYCVWDHRIAPGTNQPLHVVDDKTGTAPPLQVLLQIGIGGVLPDEYMRRCYNWTYPPSACSFESRDMVVESVTVLQPSACPTGCKDRSPPGYKGYRCDCRAR